MEDNDDGLSEQRIIEGYLQEFRIEDCIDEIVNQVVLARPPNPYLAIAQGFESKTLPETIDVKFISVSCYGSYGVKASLVTNVGTFSGTAPYTLDTSNENLEPKDFTVLNGKMKEALLSINPANFKQVEDAIVAIQDVDAAESLALSIAACRAAAKFKGVKVYQFIAELAGTREDQLCIPLPVPTLATMNIPSTKAVKTVQLFPVKFTSFDAAFTKLNQIFNRFVHHEKTAKPSRFSSSGTPWVDSASFEELCKVSFFSFIIIKSQF
jgi:hypothetical protein